MGEVRSRGRAWGVGVAGRRTVSKDGANDTRPLNICSGFGHDTGKLREGHDGIGDNPTRARPERARGVVCHVPSCPQLLALRF